MERDTNNANRRANRVNDSQPNKTKAAQIPADVVEAVAKAIDENMSDGDRSSPRLLAQAAITALIEKGWGRVDGRVDEITERLIARHLAGMYYDTNYADGSRDEYVDRAFKHYLPDAIQIADIALSQPKQPTSDMGWKMEGESAAVNLAEALSALSCEAEGHAVACQSGELMNACAKANKVWTAYQSGKRNQTIPLPPQTGQVKRDGVEGGELCS